MTFCGTEYQVLSSYINSKCTAYDKYLAVQAIIDTSLALLADTAGGTGGNIAMYELEDGQVRIKTQYRSIQDVSVGLEALEKLAQRYLNQATGRVAVLQDRRTIR